MKEKKSLFEVENLAFPESQFPVDTQEDEKPAEVKPNGKHHLRVRTDNLAVPEIEVEDDEQC